MLVTVLLLLVAVVVVSVGVGLLAGMGARDLLAQTGLMAAAILAMVGLVALL